MRATGGLPPGPGIHGGRRAPRSRRCAGPVDARREPECKDATVVEAIIFDLDDTLIVEEDTARAIAEALTFVGRTPRR